MDEDNDCGQPVLTPARHSLKSCMGYTLETEADFSLSWQWVTQRCCLLLTSAVCLHMAAQLGEAYLKAEQTCHGMYLWCLGLYPSCAERKVWSSIVSTTREVEWTSSWPPSTKS